MSIFEVTIYHCGDYYNNIETISVRTSSEFDARQFALKHSKNIKVNDIYAYQDKWVESVKEIK